MATTQPTIEASPRDDLNDPISNGDDRRWQLLLIAAFASYSPLIAWANAGESPILTTLLLTIGILVGISLVLWWVLIKIGLDSVGASYAVALFMLTLTNVGVMVGKYHDLDRLALFLAAMVPAILAYRLRQVSVLRLLMSWAALFLIAYPLTVVVAEWWTGNQASATVDVSTDMTLGTMMEKPDVLLAVFDAYGSRSVLEEFYQFENHQILATLEDEGFFAPGEITSNYARTQLSIPSLLQLEYPTESATISSADLDALGGVLTGGSRMVEGLRSHGYRHIYVESGWLGSRCDSPTIDICVSAPWPDETFFDVSYRTIMRGLPGFELGRSFSEGALGASEWLTTDLARYVGDGTPDFIFAHLLFPHPPLFLDGSCAPDWRGGQPGFAIGRPEFDEDLMQRARDGYLMQVQCANTIMSEIARLLPADTVAIFIGDHGPDGQGQLFIPGTEWDEAQKRERFGAFFAARVPGCDMEGVGSLVNVGRRVLSCMADTELPDLPLHTYDLHKASGGNEVTEIRLGAR